MLIHNLIKMKLIDNGYLPNYPYHLISDEEMINAFLGKKSVSDDPENPRYELVGYFIDKYPALSSPTTLGSTSVSMSYDNLVLTIYCILQLYLIYKADNKIYEIPDWVYSYMLGSVISVDSDKKDIHDLIYPLGVDNIDDDFDYAAEDACNKESIKWLKSSNQVATETLSNYFYYENPDTHEESGILCDTWFQDGKDQPTELSYVYTSEYSLFGSETAKKPVNAIYLRPPTIFGEPHVIKSIRLS